MIACSVPAPIEREIGFPVGERVSRRAQLASAGTVLAARLALAHGIACNTAGGSHHARRAQGAGFCTFNDVGVAALFAACGRARRTHPCGRSRRASGRRHGRDLCRRASRLHLLDAWRAQLPGPQDRVRTSTSACRTGPATRPILTTLRQALPVVAKRAAPDLVFYNAGVDPHFEDRLGRMKLSDDGPSRTRQDGDRLFPRPRTSPSAASSAAAIRGTSRPSRSATRSCSRSAAEFA